MNRRCKECQQSLYLATRLIASPLSTLSVDQFNSAALLESFNSVAPTQHPTPKVSIVVTLLYIAPLIYCMQGCLGDDHGVMESTLSRALSWSKAKATSRHLRHPSTSLGMNVNGTSSIHG